jgi:uncharacterized protein (DUF1786 family)
MNLKSEDRSILALDIGGGTQDLLVWTEGQALENSLQCVLPSPTVMAARKIRQATREGRPLFLTGHLMGGGACSGAVEEHLKSGLPVFAQPRAARTINDNLEYVTRLGVRVTEDAPAEAVMIFMADIQEQALKALFAAFDLQVPKERLVAVQDHGFFPQGSNRRFRFQQWEAFLKSGRPLESLLYENIPEHLTRMKAVQEVWPQALVMDTGAAAVLGALEDERVKNMGPSDLLIVNIGNQHTLAAWMVNDHIRGIYEHHTFFLNREKLIKDLEGFVSGRLTSEQVLEDQGHGCLNTAPGKGPLPPLVVTGPRRGLLAGDRVLMAAPFGNMMLSGCFGLLRAYHFMENLLV